ncbi:hypothetical protein ONZ45_g16699 [Pleurotus djamor]|nr:hypothetical protein ONZ45_g16699 [Pleurotus djamor]
MSLHYAVVIHGQLLADPAASPNPSLHSVGRCLSSSYYFPKAGRSLAYRHRTVHATSAWLDIVSSTLGPWPLLRSSFFNLKHHTLFSTAPPTTSKTNPLPPSITRAAFLYLPSRPRHQTTFTGIFSVFMGPCLFRAPDGSMARIAARSHPKQYPLPFASRPTSPPCLFDADPPYLLPVSCIAALLSASLNISLARQLRLAPWLFSPFTHAHGFINNFCWLGSGFGHACMYSATPMSLVQRPTLFDHATNATEHFPFSTAPPTTCSLSAPTARHTSVWRFMSSNCPRDWKIHVHLSRFPWLDDMPRTVADTRMQRCRLSLPVVYININIFRVRYTSQHLCDGSSLRSLLSSIILVDPNLHVPIGDQSSPSSLAFPRPLIQFTLHALINLDAQNICLCASLVFRVRGGGISKPRI